MGEIHLFEWGSGGEVWTSGELRGIVRLASKPRQLSCLSLTANCWKVGPLRIFNKKPPGGNLNSSVVGTGSSSYPTLPRFFSSSKSEGSRLQRYAIFSAVLSQTSSGLVPFLFNGSRRTGLVSNVSGHQVAPLALVPKLATSLCHYIVTLP